MRDVVTAASLAPLMLVLFFLAKRVTPLVWLGVRIACLSVYVRWLRLRVLLALNRALRDRRRPSGAPRDGTDDPVNG